MNGCGEGRSGWNPVTLLGGKYIPQCDELQSLIVYHFRLINKQLHESTINYEWTFGDRNIFEIRSLLSLPRNWATRERGSYVKESGRGDAEMWALYFGPRISAIGVQFGMGTGLEQESADLIVRQATITDIDHLTPLFDGYRRFYRQPSEPDRIRKFLLDRFEHNQSIIFIASNKDGAAIGFTQLYPSFSSAALERIYILNDLFVDPAARRSGVGIALLNAAADYGRRVGALRLTLSTELTNTTAQALYEKLGWKRNNEFFTYQLGLRS